MVVPPSHQTAPKLSSARITLAQIAELAGVSLPTVSKVLNGRQGVSEETRDRVNRLLSEHGYRRRGIDRRHRVGLVDLVIPGLGTLWAYEMIKGAEAEATRGGVDLVVSDAHGRRVGTHHWLRQIAARRTDGIVLVVSGLLPGTDSQLARLNTPLVLVDPVGGTAPAVPAVAATNWAGGLAATEHLLALGHRRIGVITGPPDLKCSQDRLDGYRAALQRACVSVATELIREGDFLVTGGQRAASALLRLRRPPTAIFAGSDHQAHGVYLEARSAGLRIPEDLSVVGFDDVPLCEWVQPSLTTVRQPLEEMAAEATRMVLELAGSSQAGPVRRELATSLVVRASTAAPAH